MGVDYGEFDMIYKFKEMFNKDILDNSEVLFITGTNPIFSNLMIDKCSDSCKGEVTFDISSFDEFNIDSDVEINEKLDFDSFLVYSKTRKMVGKWFCLVDYSNLTKKQQERLISYMKKPTSNGLLVVTISNWKDIKGFSKNNLINKSKNINLLNLQWPDRKTLQVILSDLFAINGVKCQPRAIQLFIMRLGNQYDDYKELIDKISLGNSGKEITYDMMLSYLDGITNYAIDDFVMAIIKPVKSEKVVITRKAYKVLNTLIEDVGAKSLVKQLQRRVNSYIEYRLYINEGIIPILVPYSVEEVKKRIPDSATIKKVSDIPFKRNAKIASLTTLKDWYYMKLILDKTAGSYDEQDYLRALFGLIHRAIYNQDRLLNVIGIKDVLNENLYELDIRKVIEDYENTK